MINTNGKIIGKEKNNKYLKYISFKNLPAMQMATNVKITFAVEMAINALIARLVYLKGFFLVGKSSIKYMENNAIKKNKAQANPQKILAWKKYKNSQIIRNITTAIISIRKIFRILFPLKIWLSL